MTTQNLSRSARSMPIERRAIAICHLSPVPMMMLISRLKTNSIATRAYIHKNLVYWQCLLRADKANINIDWRWLISSAFLTAYFLLTIAVSSFLANEDIWCTHIVEWFFFAFLQDKFELFRKKHRSASSVDRTERALRMYRWLDYGCLLFRATNRTDRSMNVNEKIIALIGSMAVLFQSPKWCIAWTEQYWQSVLISHSSLPLSWNLIVGEENERDQWPTRDYERLEINASHFSFISICHKSKFETLFSRAVWFIR